VGYTPLDYDDFDGSRDTTVGDNEFQPYDRSCSSGDVLKTTHIVSRRKPLGWCHWWVEYPTLFILELKINLGFFFIFGDTFEKKSPSSKGCTYIS